MLAPPVLAWVLRGDRVESAHRGSVAAVDESGNLVASAGDPAAPIYLRSAAKPFQAMALLDAGGEKAFRLGSDEIALICASHGGEPRHVRVAARLLAKGGFTLADLACGAHPPMDERSARRLVASGEKPTPLHNNCSGKHAGLLLACRLRGLDPDAYESPEHPIQRVALSEIAAHCGTDPAAIVTAVDGCSLPVAYLPLQSLALGYARLLARARESADTGAAVRARICSALWESPGMVAGRGRFTTDFLAAGSGTWIGKEGAEGVYAIGLSGGKRGKAIGIALKLEDGGIRARDAVSLDILRRMKRLPPAARSRLAGYASPPLINARGLQVGRIV
ncbi:MAG TPA: asparaginase, partial [Thermoanaerobaculia bacterium]|nr:asparaginase [Thermoanaerobaculia bacterium]